MGTITEDYVSFEVAKLLVRKGLKYNDAEYESYYTIHGEVVFFKDSHTAINIAPRFTIQTAMKWLRKEHNIMVSPYALSLGYYFEIFDLTNRDITGCKPLYKVGIPNKEDVLYTYEQACEAGINYYLEHFIR